MDVTLVAGFSDLQIDQWIGWLRSIPGWAILITLLIATAALILLGRFRWKEAKSLEKCAFVSVGVHIWVLGIFLLIPAIRFAEPEVEERIQIVAYGDPGPDQSLASRNDSDGLAPWEQFRDRAWTPPLAPEIPRPQIAMSLAPTPEKQLDLAVKGPATEVGEIAVEDVKQEPNLDQLPEEASYDTQLAADVQAEPEAPEPVSEAALVARPIGETALPRSETMIDVEVQRASQELPKTPENRLVSGMLPLENQASQTTGPEPESELLATVDPTTQQPDPEINRDVRPEQIEARSEPTRPELIPANVAVAAQKIEAPSAVRPADSVLQAIPEPRPTVRVTSAVETNRPDNLPGSPDNYKPIAIPAVYKLRYLPNRMPWVARRGGNDQTERSVNAGLGWLASNQEADGRWSALKHGAGKGSQVDGHERPGAGTRADTGVTGLALLAFMGRGITHQEGPHMDQVAKGLEFLIRTQADDGSLTGEATLYAAMYCHAMAAFALAEAYASTGDPTLRKPVEKAIGYTIRAQHPTNGSWRYRPGDEGDTSLLGWQLMAIQSARSAGIVIPRQTDLGMVRYLKSVSSGTYGGLAKYRPVPGARPNPVMTAESLYCRQMLGMARQNPASNEAGDYLLSNPPNAREVNYYYWYYSSLAMFNLEGTYWESWNLRMRQTVVSLQRESGELQGSWDPNGAWGGIGGRVYSTSLAVLCLETYYRYLPRYLELDQ